MDHRFDNFVSRANEIHNSKYDYSKFRYVSAKTSGIIICPIHGEFTQKPDHHTRKNAIGCPKCVNLRKKEVSARNVAEGKLKGAGITPKEEYLSRLLEKHGDKFTYNLDSYEGISNGTVTLSCKDHGEEIHSPISLLSSSHGCASCAALIRKASKTKSYDNLLEDVVKVHGIKYTLPESNRSIYLNRKSIVEVECPVHGIFKKKAQKLLAGQGCFLCRIDSLVKSGQLPGGYTKDKFLKDRSLAEKNAILYYLKINSHCYKVGITTTSIKHRINSLKSISKNYIQQVEIIQSLLCTLENAFELEQYLLDLYSEHRLYRRWSTELFNHDVLSDTLLSDLAKEMHIPTNTLPETLTGLL